MIKRALAGCILVALSIGLLVSWGMFIDFSYILILPVTLLGLLLIRVYDRRQLSAAADSEHSEGEQRSLCPSCGRGDKLRWSKIYNSWACDNCGKYLFRCTKRMS